MLEKSVWNSRNTMMQEAPAAKNVPVNISLANMNASDKSQRH